MNLLRLTNVNFLWLNLTSTKLDYQKWSVIRLVIKA